MNSFKEKYVIGLVDVFAPQYIYENIGINRISAYLRQKDISVKKFNIFVNSSREEKELLINELVNYQVIGFSTYHSNLDEILHLSELIKNRNSECYIVLGSKFVTSVADQLIDNECVDAVILGDGEYALHHLCEKMIRNKKDEIGNHESIITKDNRNHKSVANININELPWPDRDVDIIKKIAYASVITTNKCIGRCSFCVTDCNEMHVIDNRISFRTSHDFVNELNNIYEKTGNKFFYIVDGSFEDPGEIGKEKIKNYVQALEENAQKYAFAAYIKANSFKSKEDIELLKRMQRVGFTQLFVGIEAGNEEDLRIYNKIAHMEDNYRIIRILEECNINPIIGFININPYSTLEKLKENYIFLDEIHNYQMSRYVINLGVYVNTPIHKRLKNENLLLNSYNYKNIYDYKFVSEDVEKIACFIKTNMVEDQIYLEEVKLFNFIYFYYANKTLYPEVVMCYENDWENLKDKFYHVNSNYFKIIFQDNNLTEALSKLADYKKKMYLLYKELEKLKIRLMLSLKKKW